MSQTNAKKPSVWESFSLGLKVLFGGLLLFALGAAGRVEFVAILGGLAVFGSVFLFLWFLADLAKAGWKAVGEATDLRVTPAPIVPIEATGAVFDISLVTPVEADLPEVKGEWLSISGDQQLLQAYAGELDERRSEVDAHVRGAITRFNTDRGRLLDQQKNVLRRAFQGKLLLKRFRSLPTVQLSTANLPLVQRLLVPAGPPRLTLEQFARKYSTLPNSQAIGSGIARIFSMNGGVTQANVVTALIATAVAVVGSAIYAKNQVSKAKRALEIARGELETHCAGARTTLALLGRSHEEVVTASAHMRQVATEIDVLCEVIRALPARATDLNALTPGQQEQSKTLWYWVLAADQVARDTVA